MLFLLLAIVSSAAIAVLMRVLDSKIQNNMVMFTANYVICGLLSFLFMMTDHPGIRLDFSLSQEGFPFALFFGLFSGVMYLVSFVLLQFNIKKNGMILASTFMKLGVLVPVVMAVLFFGEEPGIVQILGFVLALGAIIIINGETKKGEQETLPNRVSKKSVQGAGIWLIVLLLMGGFTDATSNIYDKTGNADLRNQFLLFIFIAAILLSVIMVFVKKQRFTLVDAFCGIVIGIPNYFSSRFLLYALADVPAIVAYPVYNIAVILIITSIGILIFHEKLSNRKKIGMLLIVAAIVLLNI